MKTKNRAKGFTLVELLVVMAIIGILVAIAVPRMAKMSEEATKTTALANHRTLVGIIPMFQLAEGHFPTGLQELITEEYIDADFKTKTPTVEYEFNATAMTLTTKVGATQIDTDKFYNIGGGSGSSSGAPATT
jgi:prepilin-type N-terminal cleavage/methylation domain-containing protein